MVLTEAHCYKDYLLYSNIQCERMNHTLKIMYFTFKC